MTNFEELLDRAHAAALAAAQANEAASPDWFPCGFAWVTVRGTTPLARHCRSMVTEHGRNHQRYGDKGYPTGWTWWCPGLPSTQRMTSHEAGARAFSEVLLAAGIECEAGSRMD